MLKIDFVVHIIDAAGIKSIGGCCLMLEFINTYILGVAVPTVLIVAGAFYAVRLRFFNLTHPHVIIKTLTAPSGDGMSPLRALCLALAGTLGVGNIVGVASAIYLGGAGAIFWMWISAAAAMLLKYAETVLALGHSRTDESGARHGGAMYYIRDFFTSCGLSRIGTILAALFAGLCIVDALSMGCVIQINAVSRSLLGVCGLGTAFSGGVLAVITVAVLASGRDNVAALTGRLVPFMTLIYIVMSVAVIVLRRDGLAEAFGSIFAAAFLPKSALGGAAGFLLSRGVRFGTMRGLMSNEAGCGTAPIAHSGSNAVYPAQQGIWSIVEVFVDTILLCTMTALVIILSPSDVLAYGTDPIMMTMKAYSFVLGQWSEYVMCVMVLFFGFATVICWGHYGIECVEYLAKHRRGWRRAFIALYGVAVLAGALSAPERTWDVADFALGVMTLINLSVICPMSGEVARQTRYYLCTVSGKKRKPQSPPQGLAISQAHHKRC